MRLIVGLTLVCVGFVPTWSNAATLDKDVNVEIIDDWSNGLNTQMDASKLAKTYSPNMSNLLIDEIPGSLVTRNGSILAASTPTLSKITFMFPFIKQNGDNEFIISDSSRVLSTRDFATYVLIKATLTPTALLRAAQIRDKIWFTNGIEPVFTWNGIQHNVLDGNNGTPNVPRCKYIAFYQERAFLFNTVNANYALYWSALTSSITAGAISPDTTAAWLIENQLNIGQGDGQAGTGLDIMRGQLVMHKSDGVNGSIYTLFGNDVFTYVARKTNAEVGTNSNDSIVQLDNLEYFLGKNGVYAFDGGESKRISDAIKPDMDNVVSNLTRIIAQTWDTKTDFDRGSTFNKTTTTASGLVWLISSTLQMNVIGVSTPVSGSIRVNPSISPNSPFSILIPTVAIEPNFVGDVPTVTLWGNCNACSQGYRAIVRNIGTGKQWLSSLGAGPTSVWGKMSFANFCSTDSNAAWTKSEIEGSQFAIQLQLKNPGFDDTVCPDNGGVSSTNIEFDFFPASAITNANVTLRPVTTGQYISEIATVTTVNYWDQFSVADFPNGGSIIYYIKGATSPVNISTEIWATIGSGANVGLSVAKNYYQWAATMTSVSSNTIPAIDYVTVRHNEGSADENRPLGIPWNGRYLLAVATEANTSRSVIFVKSKITSQNPIAWTRWDGLNLRSFAIYNGNLYGGSSSTGAVYRLDYGANDSGNAINWFYETPNMSMGRRFYEKMLQDLMLETTINGGTLNLSRSVNGGTYSNSTIDLSGSGRLFSHVLSAQEKGRYFRFKFYGASLDTPIQINTFGAFFKDLPTR